MRNRFALSIPALAMVLVLSSVLHAQTAGQSGAAKPPAGTPLPDLSGGLGGQYARPSVGRLFLQSEYSSDDSLGEAAIPFREAFLRAQGCRRFHRLRESDNG